MMALTAASAFAQSGLQSGIDRANMDLGVKPGTDFFEYSAGGWRKAHPLTPEYSRYSQFEYLQENNQKQLRELIEGIASASQAPGSLEQKIGSLYRLAMDSTRRNAEGWKPLQPLYRKVQEAKDKRALFVLSAQLGRIGIFPFFGVSCMADIKDSRVNLVQIYQGGLSMGEREYYLENDEATRKVRAAFRDYAKQLFVMTGSDEASAARKADVVLGLETRLAKAAYSATQRRDVENNYHKMAYADLLNDYPLIDWGTLFLQLGYPAFESVSVSQPEPVHEAGKLLDETPLEDLKTYLAYKLVDDAAGSLDDRFRMANFEFYGRVMRGAQEDKPRWKRAVSTVEGVMGEAVGKMYVEKYFPETSKRRMLELVRNLQTALRERIGEQKWMSEATKQQAYEKLDNFYVKIGYPDKWMDYSGLTIDDSLSFYENLCRASEFLTDYRIRKTVNKPVDRDEWQMTPQTINAYYDPTTNEICFPAGILQPPFFNPAADDACNYGAIGVVIGHEMTHGFDDQGSQFDKDGNLRNWWTESDKANFKERTEQLADFFDKIEVLPGMRANGKLTLGENIADHGGLNVAYQALQNAMKKQPLSAKDGFTPEQRFFLSYGFIWANNIRPEMLRQLNKMDPHSPGKWRVNGTLPHINAWYDAFGIKKGDPLFLPKKERVDVW